MIVAGKIPYVITKENGVYFDVVKNKRVGEETALQLVSRYVSFLSSLFVALPETLLISKSVSVQYCYLVNFSITYVHVIGDV